MAPNRRVYALLFILNLFFISSTARKKNRIIPDETIGIIRGAVAHGKFEAGEIGARIQNDYRLFMVGVYIRPARFFGTVQRERIFQTPKNEIITMVRIEDPEYLPAYTGGLVRITNNGPGFRNVTLKFYSKWNTGINKIVTLYGRR